MRRQGGGERRHQVERRLAAVEQVGHQQGADRGDHHRAERGEHQGAEQDLGDKQAARQRRMIGAGHPSGGGAGHPQFPLFLVRKALSEQRAHQRCQQDHRTFAADGAAARHHQQRRQALHQAGAGVQLAVAGLDRFHIVGGRRRALVAVALVNIQQQARRQAAQRRSEGAPPAGQRGGGGHQAAVGIAEQQPLEANHRTVEQPHRQSGGDADEHGDKQAAQQGAIVVQVNQSFHAWAAS